MGDIIKYEKGTVAHKVACIVYPDRHTVEVQLKGHKLQVIFNNNGSYSIKEYDDKEKSLKPILI